MRTILKMTIALTIALLLAGPALSEKGGNSNGNGNGNGSSGGLNSRNANGHNKHDDKDAPVVSPSEVVVVPDDQQVARDAVSAKTALSLEQVTAIVMSGTDGRIVDVQLVSFKGMYLYDVTVLEKDGVLHKLYYDARSGRPVRTN